MAETKRTRKEVLAAVRGCHGIISEAARALGVDRVTVYRYMDRWQTVREAVEDERQAALDLAESVVVGNVMAARAQQEADPTAVVDSSDARWILAKLGADRGYAERAEVDLGGELTLTIGFREPDDD